MKNIVIDIHAHCTIPEVAEVIKGTPLASTAGAGGGGLTTLGPMRLQQMDDAGVQMQVLSPAASPPYAEKESDAVEAARLIVGARPLRHLVTIGEGRGARGRLAMKSRYQ